MSLLNIVSVSKVFKQGDVFVHALREVSLTVQSGEFTALVGPSGSGKTTLLNLIGGLDTCSEGCIEVAGANIAEFNDAQLSQYRLLDVGFVFQAYNLVPVLSARENVELIMVLQGKSSKDAHVRATQYLTMVGLEGQMNNRPAHMSGGQQQRVAIARALAGEPKLILADEPTANLDSANANILLDIMHRLCKEQNKTFIFSTHDPRVMARAERILTLTDGCLTQDSSQSAQPAAEVD